MKNQCLKWKRILVSHTSHRELICKIYKEFNSTMEKAMAPPPVLLPGKSHGRRRPEGWSPWGRWGSDTTEQLHFHFSLSCIGEGTGNPLQCSCLENPRDGGAWWAAVYGVTQSRTRLKRLSIAWNTVWSFHKKFKIELPYDPAIPLLCVYSKERKSLP